MRSNEYNSFVQETLDALKKQQIEALQLSQHSIEEKTSIEAQINTRIQEQFHILSEQNISELVCNELMDIDTALGLTWDHVTILKNQAIMDQIWYGHLALHTALAYPQETVHKLNHTVCALIAAKKISFDDAIKLSLDECNILDSPNISRLVLEGNVPYKELLKSRAFQYMNIPDYAISLLIKKKLTWDNVSKLSDRERGILQSQSIQELISLKKLTINRALQLTSNQLLNFESIVIRAAFINKTLSFPEVLQITEVQRIDLNHPLVIEEINKGTVTVREILSSKNNVAKNASTLLNDPSLSDRSRKSLLLATDSERACYESSALRDLVSAGHLSRRALSVMTPSLKARLEVRLIRNLFIRNNNLQSRQMILNMSEERVKTLSSPIIEDFISKTKITLDEAWRMNPLVRSFIERPEIVSLLEKDILSYKRIMEMGFKKAQLFTYPLVIFLVESNVINVDQVLAMTEVQCRSFKSPQIEALFKYNKLSLDQIMGLTDLLRQRLESERIAALFKDNKLTLDQIMGLTDLQCRLLESERVEKYFPDINQRLRLSEREYAVLHFPWSEDLIDNHQFQLNDLTQLRPEMIEKLNKYPGAARLLCRKILTPDVFFHMTELQYAHFESPKIMDLLDQNVLSLSQIMDLTELQRSHFESEKIVILFRNNVLSFEDIKGLSVIQRGHFESDEIIDLWNRRILNKEQMMCLTQMQRESLKIEWVRKYFPDIQALLNLSDEQHKILQSPWSEHLIVKQGLDKTQLWNLPTATIDRLNQYGGATKLIGNEMTPEGPPTLSIAQTFALKEPNIVRLIQDGHMTEAQLKKIYAADRAILSSDWAMKLIYEKKMSVHDVLNLPPYMIDYHCHGTSSNLYNLVSRGIIPNRGKYDIGIGFIELIEKPAIQKLLIAGALSYRQLRSKYNYSLSAHDRHNPMLSEALADMIIRKRIPFLDVMLLGQHARNLLLRPELEQLIEANILSVQRLADLSEEQLTALLDPETRAQLLRGELRLVAVIGNGRMARAQAALPAINSNQSTHTSSVHKSVSASVSKLRVRYFDKIEAEGLELITTKLRDYIMAQPDDTFKQSVAKRAIERLIRVDYTDNESQTNIRQLLALIYMAINDKDMRKGTMEDAYACFTDSLNDIQRGYNNPQESDGRDLPICLGGTFNKLTESLVGIHPDVEIKFISHELAAVKFQKIVYEEAKNHIAAHRQTRGYNALIAKLEEDGVEVIWEQIKPSVHQRLFDEFKSLYQGVNDPRYTALLEAGVFINIDLEKIQEELKMLHSASSSNFFSASSSSSSSSSSAPLPPESRGNQPG